MRKSRWMNLALLAVVVIAAAPVEASQLPSVATTTINCPVDQPTRVKNLDPLQAELFLQDPGMDLKLTAIVNLFPIDPALLGVNKTPKGKAFLNWKCFDGFLQRSRGRDKEKVNSTGAAAAAQRVPAGAECFFFGVDVDWRGSRILPEGTNVGLQLGAQAVVPDADPGCFDEDTICLADDNRFKVEVDWRDFGGASGPGIAFPRSDDSGTFFFLDPDNTELLIKLIDGCAFNDHFWVFYAATTNVEFEVTVTDTLTNTSRVYDNPLGQPAPAIVDTQAFATCP